MYNNFNYCYAGFFCSSSYFCGIVYGRASSSHINCTSCGAAILCQLGIIAFLYYSLPLSLGGISSAVKPKFANVMEVKNSET